jgi:glycine/D-amino acid oxidase-like deaminating enzyme
MRARILPARGVVTAQKPPKDLGITPKVAPPTTAESWTGTRSFVFFPEASARSFCYLTQQPAPSGAVSSEHGGVDELNEYPSPAGELMLGGTLSGNDLKELGISDDRGWNRKTKDYLSRAVTNIFVAEDTGGTKGDGDQTHMLGHWSGIMGISVDSIPWVGRIPESISGRLMPNTNINGMGDNTLAEVHEALDSEETIASSHKASARLAAPGEWMAAGYSGEGMVHAWMSAKALAYMVLGLDKDGMESSDKLDDSLGEWFPDVFRLTEERWTNTGVEDLIARAVY